MYKVYGFFNQSENFPKIKKFNTIKIAGKKKIISIFVIKSLLKNIKENGF